MANEEQLACLRQGADTWNAWRRQAKDIDIDLRDAYLGEADLRGADLGGADLRGASLSRADLNKVALRAADLSGADLYRAYLGEADLIEANLSGAYLAGADFSEADLSGANLTKARVQFATLRDTRLRKTVCSGAVFRDTVFANVDLSSCVGLESCFHHGPSTIDIQTLQRSGPLPLAFLRGIGLPDRLIEYLPSLLDQAIQFYSCFISYASKDDAFARRLHADLQNNGVRCWFDAEDMKIGAKIRDVIEQAIRLRDKVLLVLSEASLASTWVEGEVEKAFEEERQRGGPVLFPVRLDDAVLTTQQAWAAHLRRGRHIGDFRAWKDHDTYQHTLARLLRDLRVETADAASG